MELLPGDLAQTCGLFACFEKESFGREKPHHRCAFLGAPVEVEGNGDGADLGNREQRLEMLGAAAAGEADQVAFSDALSEQVIRQPVGALMELAIRDCSKRVDDGAFVGKVLPVAR